MILRSPTGSAACEITSGLPLCRITVRLWFTPVGLPRATSPVWRARRAVDDGQLQLNRAIHRDERPRVHVQIDHLGAVAVDVTDPAERILPHDPLLTTIDTVFFSGASRTALGR